MTEISQGELIEAKRALDSLLSKSKNAQVSLIDKDPNKYKGQLTLLKNRIRALEISVNLIEREIGE